MCAYCAPKGPWHLLGTSMETTAGPGPVSEVPGVQEPLGLTWEIT